MNKNSLSFLHLKEGEENNMEDKKGDLQSNGVLKQNLLLQTSKKINRNLNKKIKEALHY